MLWGDGNGYRYHHGWQMMDGSGGVAAWVMLVLVVLVLGEGATAT